MEPKVNEFWVTVLGRVCLVVRMSASDRLVRVWWDEIDQELKVSSIPSEVLERRANYTEIQEFLRQLQPE